MPLMTVGTGRALISSRGFHVSDVPQVEGDALVWLYNHTNGPSWTDHTNWLVTHTVGNWFGITVGGGHVTQVALNTNGLNGNIGAFPINNLLSLSLLRLESNGSISGNLGGWILPAALSQLRLNNTSVSGNVGAWTLPAALTQLYLNNTSVSGNIGGWILPALVSRLMLYSTSVSGTPDISGNTAMSQYLYSSCGLTQANVNAVLLSIYTRRMAFTDAAPVLNAGGTNDAPSGVYQDGDPPTTGLEYVYEIANDPEAEGFNTWAVTYTGGTAP